VRRPRGRPASDRLPLLVGLSKNKPGLAAGGMIACAVSGLILGLILAVPVALLFLFIILAGGPAEQRPRRDDPWAAERDRAVRASSGDEW
jgi:hypothetical protein